MTGFTISPLSEIPVSAIVELWNEEVGERFPMSIALWKQNTTNEPNVMKEGSFAVIEEGNLQGIHRCEKIYGKVGSKDADECRVDPMHACRNISAEPRSRLGITKNAEQALIDARSR